MKEKILGIIEKTISNSDMASFLSLLKEKAAYIKDHPLSFAISSRSDIEVFFNLLLNFFKRKTFIPKNTFIALFIILLYALGKGINKFRFIKENIDKDLLIGFCIYLIEKDVSNYLNQKEAQSEPSTRS